MRALCRGRGGASGETPGSRADAPLHDVCLRERAVPKELLPLAKKRPIFRNPYYKKKNLHLNIMAIIPKERCSIIKKIVR